MSFWSTLVFLFTKDQNQTKTVIAMTTVGLSQEFPIL